MSELPASDELLDQVFDRIKSKQPAPGEILSSQDGSDVLLTVSEKLDAVSGQLKKAIFCRASVDILQHGWFLTASSIGLIVMIMPISQRLLRKNVDGHLVVRSVKVIRYTPNGRALLCEVVN